MKTTTKTFRMTYTTADDIEKLSDKYGMTQTELIEKSIKMLSYLDWLKEGKSEYITISERAQTEARMLLKVSGFIAI